METNEKKENFIQLRAKGGNYTIINVNSYSAFSAEF